MDAQYSSTFLSHEREGTTCEPSVVRLFDFLGSRSAVRKFETYTQIYEPGMQQIEKNLVPWTGVTVREVAVPDDSPADWAALVSAAVRSLFAFESLAMIIKHR